VGLDMDDSYWVSADEPEIDMNPRNLRTALVGLVERLFNPSSTPARHRGALGTPCRSIKKLRNIGHSR
jgi:hypothetical protein